MVSSMTWLDLLVREAYYCDWQVEIKEITVRLVTVGAG